MKKKEPPPRRQKPTSYRLSPEVLSLLTILSEQLGISRAAVLEMAVRQLARREKTKVERGA